jgi:Uma2 family endonuclease
MKLETIALYGYLFMATPIAPSQLTFSEYLVYDDGTDNRYELVDGELVMVPLPTAEHGDTIDELLHLFRAYIDSHNLPWKATDKAGVYTGINPLSRRERSRTPDLCVMTLAQWESLKADKKSSAVLKTPPVLVVEIVSPSSRTTDYESKRTEYESVKVPEYWIVDLIEQKVTVLTLVEGTYQEQVFTGCDRINSTTFLALELTVEKVLSV